MGDASLTARNDSARVGFAVEATARRRAVAVTRSSVRLRSVLGALKATGIAAGDVRTGSVSVTRRRDRRGRPLPGYRARQSVRALVRDAGRAGAVVAAAVTAGGIPVQGPTFFVSDPKALLRQALVAALRDARTKAGELATEAGLTLGAPISIRESGFQGGDDGSTNQSAAGSADQRTAAPAPTRPGRSRVFGTVFVVFEAQ